MIVFGKGVSIAAEYFENSSIYKFIFWFVFIILNRYFISNYGKNLFGKLFDINLMKNSYVFKEYPKTMRLIVYW
jgi:hypothetical protein